MQERASHPDFAGAWRATSHAYNVDGDLLAVHYGDRNGAGAGLLTERFAYDGLRRLTTYTDARRYSWQLAYTTRGQLARFKQDATPYGAPAPAPPIWESAFAYDDRGDVVSQSDNGIRVAQYERTATGLPYRLTAIGRGASHVTYDLLGRPVWSRDAAGNQTVHTWRPDPHEAGSASIRTDGSPT